MAEMAEMASDLADLAVVEGGEQSLAEHPDVQHPVTYDNNARPSPEFSNLPYKLRYTIWKIVMEDLDQRIFHAKLGSAKRNYKISFWNCPNPPAVLQVCQESRDIAKDQLKLIFTDAEGNGTWWNPKVDILYTLATNNLLSKGYNFVIQNIAIDWRLCLITLTPRRLTVPFGGPLHDMDIEFTLTILRIFKDYPGIKSISIFVPEKQPTNLFMPSEPTPIKTIPITGLTDITVGRVLLGNGLARLHTSALKISSPFFRGYWLGKVCDEFPWLFRILSNDTLNLEIRQFILHRSWPDGQIVHGMALNENLPEPGRNDWPMRVPRHI
ncbi:hypothetical protein VP1G_02888 [Cytospora mali]|uniref:2EXR domain-containing protein n=1 Tax=Cytospora mali TaxID=578113 RepID=A0A194UV62_CYTMA|nr:hypothetical protein VP1G_02888 [Valsa mali var. pyri (nom. inval.)]